MKVAISELKIDEAIYPRTLVSEFVVTRMTDALAAGARFPEITIEAGTLRLVDGRKRYEVYQRKGIKEVDAVVKSYASEEELFADAVRLNIEHGQPLTNYEVRNAVARFQRAGYPREAIGEIVRLPAARIDAIVKGFGQTEQGEPIALKGGLQHKQEEPFSASQRAAMRRYAGSQAVFYARQLILVLEHDLWPRHSEVFREEMDRLAALWADPPTAEAAE